MKVTLPSSAHLKSLVGWAAAAIGPRPVIPIMACTPITVDPDGTVAAAGYDYELCGRAEIPAGVATDVEAGQVIIGARYLLAIAEKLPARQPVTLKTRRDGKLTVTCGGYSANLVTVAEEDFKQYPKLPVIPSAAWRVQGDWLKEALARVLPATGSDDTLPALTGVHVLLDGETLTLEATDRYRVAEARLRAEYDDVNMPPQELIIPAAMLAKWQSACPAEQEVLVSVAEGPVEGQGRLGLAVPGRSMTFQTIGAEYPRVDAFLNRGLYDGSAVEDGGPKAGPVLTVSAEQLAAVAERASLVTLPHAPIVLRLAADSLTVLGTGGEDESSESLDVAYDGPEADVAFNPAYLQQAVKAATLGISDDVLIRFQTSADAGMKPVLITSCDETDAYSHVLMPVRLAAAPAKAA